MPASRSAAATGTSDLRARASTAMRYLGANGAGGVDARLVIADERDNFVDLLLLRRFALGGNLLFAIGLSAVGRIWDEFEMKVYGKGGSGDEVRAGVLRRVIVEPVPQWCT